jgi:PAS domain S-box-containing protein
VQISLGRVGKRDQYATLAVVRDVSTRPTADHRERILDVAVAAAANGVAITDAAGNFIFVNPAFTHLTGYTAEEVIGKSTRVLKSGRHDEAFYRDLWTTVSRGDVWHGETVNRRKDGSLYVEEQTIAPVRDAAGAITHYVAIKQDVTARRSAEEALRRRVRELGVLHQLAEIAIETTEVERLTTRFTTLLRDHLDLLSVDLEIYQNPADTSGPPSSGSTQPRFRASTASVASGGDTLVYPLQVGERDIGVLRVRVRPYDLERPEYERFFETIATQIAGAIARARIQEDLERIVKTLR